MRALTMNQIAPVSDYLKFEELPHELRKIKGLHKTDFSKKTKVDYLIGLPTSLHLISKIEPVPHYPDLFLLTTPWGKIFAGVARRVEKDENANENENETKFENEQDVGFYQSYLSSMDKLTAVMQKFYEIESLPFDQEEKLTSDELECLAFMKKNTTYDSRNRKFTVKLPWRQRPILPNNRKSVLSYFFNEERKMLKPENKVVCAEYNERMAQGFTDGFFEAVSPAEAEAAMDLNRSDLHFIPHFGVWRPGSESTKCRVVMNCKYGTPVLGNNRSRKNMNDFQHKGPKQTRDIDKMQLEWRRHLMVWLGDLKQQFHQINVHKDDHQYLYFFWRPFGSKQKPIMAKIRVLQFGFRCAPFVASYILSECVKLAKEKAETEEVRNFCDTFMNKVYCDDLMFGGQTVPELLRLKELSEFICNQGSFEITKFKSNSKEFLSQIPEHQRSKDMVYEFAGDTETIELSETKSLGFMEFRQ